MSLSLKEKNHGGRKGHREKFKAKFASLIPKVEHTCAPFYPHLTEHFPRTLYIFFGARERPSCHVIYSPFILFSVFYSFLCFFAQTRAVLPNKQQTRPGPASRKCLFTRRKRPVVPKIISLLEQLAIHFKHNYICKCAT